MPGNKLNMPVSYTHLDVYKRQGTHYVSDLNEPHHASNLTAVNSNHSAFEKYVDKNRKSYTTVSYTHLDVYKRQ